MGSLNPTHFPMKKHLKSRSPALNIPRHHDATAADTIVSDTPAVDSGVKQATDFCQPLQVQSHLEMPRILVQLGHTQRT